MRKYFLLIISLCLLFACKGYRSQQASTDHATPISLDEQLLHYWDSFPYADTAVWTDTARMRGTLAKWTEMLVQMPDSVASKYTAAVITAGNGQPDGQQALFLWVETWFNNPNSPYRNEELFIPVLEAMIEDSLQSEVGKKRPRMLLADALKNRKGTKAADIAFITADGRQMHLYDIHCEQLLLYFFNPDCHDCKRVSHILMNDPGLSDAQKEGRLQVVALYPDTDLASWKKMDNSYPSSWLIGRAPTAQEQKKDHLPNLQEAYSLPAIPSIYILDSTYTVVVKDGVVQ